MIVATLPFPQTLQSVLLEKFPIFYYAKCGPCALGLQAENLTF